jgi:hypothetical protein
MRVKMNFTLYFDMKAQRRIKVELYSFLNFGARWGWMVNTKPRPL